MTNEREVVWATDQFILKGFFSFGALLESNRSNIQLPELQFYVEDFGSGLVDICYVAEVEEQVVGAVWVRIMNDYGHMKDGVASIAISVYKQYWGHGIGAELLQVIKENQFEGEAGLFQIDVEKLQKINPDVIGWLIIPAADVDHVVIQRTDNEYYVRRNLYEEYQYSGTIFIDHRWSEEKSKNLLVYGHNMSNDTMLGQLECYLDLEVCRDYPYFWYVTPDEVYKCAICSIYITDIYNDYVQTDFLAETDFLDFVDQVLYKSYYDFGLEVTEEDKFFRFSPVIWQEAIRDLAFTQSYL